MIHQLLTKQIKYGLSKMSCNLGGVWDCFTKQLMTYWLSEKLISQKKMVKLKSQ